MIPLSFQHQIQWAMLVLVLRRSWIASQERKNIGPQFFLRHTEIRFLAQVFLATKFWHWENLSTPLQLATACSWLLNAFGGSIWPAFWRLLPWDAVFGQLIDSLHHGHDCIKCTNTFYHMGLLWLPACCTIKKCEKPRPTTAGCSSWSSHSLPSPTWAVGGSQPIRRRGLKLQAKDWCHWKHPKIILVTKNSLRINWRFCMLWDTSDHLGNSLVILFGHLLRCFIMLSLIKSIFRSRIQCSLSQKGRIFKKAKCHATILVQFNPFHLILGFRYPWSM